MNTLIALCALLVAATTLAATATREDMFRRMLPALRHEEIHDDFGQYAYRYVTAEGVFVSERGHLIPTRDGKDFVMAVDGELSYLGEDGKLYTKKYSSGLDGFKADADAIQMPTLREPVLVL